MIENNLTVRVNQNIETIMNFICYYMDEYVNTGKVKSIRKVETVETNKLSDTETSIKRYYFFAPILPEFINSLIGDSMDLFLTYSEEILFDFKNHKSITKIEQVNNFYNGRYDVEYKYIDETTTEINISFSFELQLKSYSMFSMSAVIETIVSQIFIAEMKKFYNNLSDDIEKFIENE